MLAFAQPNNLIDFPQPQGKSNEWYTPARYIEAAREVMGGIDLDPASSEMANRTVRATRYYTRRENGLLQPWYGCMWLNPPFNKEDGKSTIGKWSSKLVECYKSGAIEQAILLGAGQTASAWFADIWEYPICFPNHHIRFYCPQLDKVSGQRDCTFMAYLGKNEQEFIEIFSKFGPVARCVSQPRQQVTPLSLWEVCP